MSEPAPIPNDSPSMHDLVIARLQERKRIGLANYGTVLQAQNGRDALEDLIDELADGMCYAMQAKVERDGLNDRVAVLTLSCDNMHAGRELAEARVVELESLTVSEAERIAKQSDLLSKKAEAIAPGETMSERDVLTAAERLRTFIKLHLAGGCRMFSQGDSCECALCDFDRLTARLAEHPSDSEEEFGNDYLESRGFVYVAGLEEHHAGGYVISVTEADLDEAGESGYFGEELRLVDSGDGWCPELRTRKTDWSESVGLAKVTTRGQLRALCIALGITLPEPTPAPKQP